MRILTHLHSYNKKIHKKTGFTNPAFFNTNCFTYQDALQHPSLMNLKIKTHSVICDSKAITNILKRIIIRKNEQNKLYIDHIYLKQYCNTKVIGQKNTSAFTSRSVYNLA